MRTRTVASTWLGVVAAACAIASAVPTAQDQLAAAKDLYALAAYEDALSALTHAKGAASADVAQIDQYRTFCLFALGRTSEAESVAEALVRQDPLLRLDARDASPRIEAMFTEVRKRLLPGLIREGYRSARTAMDQGQKTSAAQQLARVRLMLDNAKTLQAWDEGLDDVGLLVDGFLDLARVAAARQSEAEPKAPALPIQQIAAAEKVEPPAMTTPQVYESVDADVKPPVTIRQDIPKVPVAIVSAMKRANKTSGILDIIIGEDGAVTEAIMRVPVNSIFDSLMITAARSWQYRPAMKDGRPVRFLKRIAVSVALTPSP